MKKLVLKTALITFIAACVVLLSLFGIMSLAAPVAMMNITASLGLGGMSSDYAYEAYGRNEEIGYLARAAEVAYANGNYKKADDRFKELIAHQSFKEYSESRDRDAGAFEGAHTAGTYRAYIYSSASCAKYHLAETEEEKSETINFAIDNTEKNFPEYNAVIALAVEARRAENAEFCGMLKDALKDAVDRGRFDGDNTDLNNVIKFLEDFE